MTARIRLAVAACALSALIVVGVGLLGTGLWAEASAAERTVLRRVAGSQAAFLATGGVLLLGLVAATVVRLFAGPLRTPRRLAADTRLIATVNAGHRLSQRRPAELGELAAAINTLAERYEAAERDVAARVEAGRSDLVQERNRLAALMSELAAAVLVCNADGRILLYNAAARRLLENRPDRPGAVGLGRSVFGLIDPGLIAHVLDRTTAGVPAQATTAWAGRILRVQVAPVAAAGDAGFVLLVEDVTRRLETSRHRDALLRDLTEGVRASTGVIRGAAENLIEYSDMPADQRDRFIQMIQDEALTLGQRVDDMMRRSAGHLTDRSLHADVSGADLLTMVAAAVAAERGPRVAVEVPSAGVWLSLDGYTAVRAVAALIGHLRSARGLDEVTLGLRPAEGHLGRYAALDVRWRGAPVDAQTLRAWAGERAGSAGADIIEDVLARHEAELWSQAEPDGWAYLRLLLPLADAAGPRTAEPATVPEPDDADDAAANRPEFYDFDLLLASGGEVAWEQRPLDEIAYTVFDTETTGLQPADGDEIIAIGAVRVVHERLLRQEVLDLLVDPRRPVPVASRRIHGISPDMLLGQPTIEEALPAFARFAEDTVLVGHNVSFDLAFLRRKEAQTGVVLSQPVLDTLLLSAAIHPDHDQHTLEAISARLGVGIVGRHSALGDALLTAEIFVRMLPLLRQRGVRTVGEAREAARRTYHARVNERRYPVPSPGAYLAPEV
jgi:DNA polymerase-3 subunit epsilon